MKNKFPTSLPVRQAGSFQFPISFQVINLRIRKLITNWRLETDDWKFTSAFSLLEVLVVVSIFAILGILITRSVLLTLSGGKKSESLVSVRENLNYSLGVVERQLRNANSISDCTNTSTSQINYIDANGNPASFSCVVGGTGSVGYIASGSAKLSSDTVNVTSCSFTCNLGEGVPSSVTINLEATDVSGNGTENSVVTEVTQVSLRNY